MDDLGIFSAFDDNMMLNQIQATHSRDGLELNVGSVLELIENIFKRVEPNIEAVLNGGHEEISAEESDDTNAVSDTNGVLESLAFMIQKVSCEISYKCSKGRDDAHASTMFLLNTLSSYSWDTKVVISLAAFAKSYGEFFLVMFCYPTNNLAKSISLLKQLPNAIENSSALKSHFDILHNLIKAMMDVTKCVIELQRLPRQHISPEDPPLSNALAHIPTAVYWTIRSVVACAAQMASFVGMSYEYIESTMESWEVSRLAHKEKNIHDHLLQQLDLCCQHISQQASLST